MANLLSITFPTVASGNLSTASSHHHANKASTFAAPCSQKLAFSFGAKLFCSWSIAGSKGGCSKVGNQSRPEMSIGRAGLQPGGNKLYVLGSVFSSQVFFEHLFIKSRVLRRSLQLIMSRSLNFSASFARCS